METVAEGVETVDQLRGVAELGCSQAQGFLFAAPMPIGDVPSWLERWRWQGPRLLGRAARGARLSALPQASPGRLEPGLSLAG
jgi:predicted signal transduction protein with EAL and GGDEF domain